MYPRLYLNQRGATLIVSLLVLVVLSLLSISAMNSAAMQERMSGHLRDGQLAFESADAALRDSEQRLDTQVQPATPCDAVATGCDLFSASAMDALDGVDGRPWWAEGNDDWWQQHGHDFIATGPDLARQPGGWGRTAG